MPRRTSEPELKCALCEETFTNEETFRTHVAKAHAPPRQPCKFEKAVLKVLKDNNGTMEKQALMEQEHLKEPTKSKKGAKAYSKFIHRLVNDGHVKVETVVTLVE